MKPQTKPNTGDIPGADNLKHFLYKSKSHIQFTSSLFEPPFDVDAKQQKRYAGWMDGWMAVSIG